MAAIVHGYELDDGATWNPSAENSADAPNESKNPSAEGFPTMADTQRRHPADVREARGIYRLRALTV